MTKNKRTRKFTRKFFYKLYFYFNKDKISNAIFRALAATSKADHDLADQHVILQKIKRVRINSKKFQQGFHHHHRFYHVPLV